MIFRTGHGWQTTTADLALILFLVVSAAGTGVPPGPASAEHPDQSIVSAAPPAGIYRPTKAASLSDWLAAQSLDDRQVATVLVRHAGPVAGLIMEQGLAFLAEIEAAGRPGRLIIEKGTADEVLVILTYDAGINLGAANGTALAGTKP